MNVECISSECGMENAYHNGVNYECPDCGAAWDENGYRLDIDEDDDDINEEFDSLSKLAKPFFTLKHGQLYQCQIDFYNVIEKEMQTESAHIIPLAFKKDKNLFWILYDAKTMLDKYPDAIPDFIKMDFLNIWNDGIRHYFEDSMIMPLTSLCATTERNSIIDNMGEMYDFVEVVK